MSTSKGAAEPGKKRATEVMDAMKGMTAYSTDDLFFVARYGATAKNEMSTAEYAEFQRLTALCGKLEAAKDEQGVAEAEAKLKELLAPYPTLLRDFDKFGEAATRAAAAFGKGARRAK